MSEITNQAVVATYGSHYGAEEAVRLLQNKGLPMNKISIIGRDWQLREDVQGFYQPIDAIKEGAQQGAWFGGIFGMLMGIGMFILPIAGAVIVLGPLGGLIAGAIGGAGLGALVSGLMTLGIPKDQAVKYQERLQAGEFLVVVHGTPEETARAHDVLQETLHTSVSAHAAAA